MDPTKSNKDAPGKIEDKPVKKIVEPATAVPSNVSVKTALDAISADGAQISAVTHDGGKLLGTVSKGRMNREVGGRGHDPVSSPVKPQVEKEGAYCFEDQTLGEAEQLMREKKVEEVPVVNKEKVLIGKTRLGKIEEQKQLRAVRTIRRSGRKHGRKGKDRQ